MQADPNKVSDVATVPACIYCMDAGVKWTSCLFQVAGGLWAGG